MDANGYFKRGKEYLEKEHYSLATADFWKAMEMIHEPEKVALFREKSKEFDPVVVALFLMETLKQVIGSLQGSGSPATGEDPAAVALVNQGSAYCQTGDFGKAIGCLTNALNIQKNPETFFCLATAYHLNGEYQAAIDNFKLALQFKPDAEGYSQLGVSYANNGEYDAAIDSYNQAIQLEPNNGYFYLLRSLPHMEKGEKEKEAGIADLKTAADYGNKNALEFLMNLGIQYTPKWAGEQ